MRIRKIVMIGVVLAAGFSLAGCQTDQVGVGVAADDDIGYYTNPPPGSGYVQAGYGYRRGYVGAGVGFGGYGPRRVSHFYGRPRPYCPELGSPAFFRDNPRPAGGGWEMTPNIPGKPCGGWVRNRY